ncbi:MAG TPA: hypothetical protein VGG19_20560 [Tepidisphaeraceae bacterium]|jgi:hypothetical protein
MDLDPKQLAELENRVRGALAVEPSSNLRNRIMRNVGSELTITGRSNQSANWYWPAIAAMVMIVFNLSYVSASRNEFMLQPKADMQQLAGQFHQLQIMQAQEEKLFQ